MTNPILQIQHLDVAFEEASLPHYVLSQFELSLFEGACVGLVGESGSGKTMSALSILQLLPRGARVSAHSRILFRGHDLLQFSEKQMRRVRGKHIGMIFQDAMSAFNPVLTIAQQLIEVIRLHTGLKKRDATERAKDLLAQAGISDTVRCLQSYPHELSGGMRQRAMIAMAIAAEPEVIIADEPTTAVDTVIQTQLLALLNAYKQEKKCALLFIGHDLSVVKKIADDMIVLKSGKIVEKNSAELFFQHPADAYSQLLLDTTLTRAPKTPLNHAPLLSVSHLKQYFPIKKGILKRTVDYVKAVDDISFDVQAGETVALMGESGSGKTTAAKSILQLLKTTDGKIIFQQQSLRELSRKKLRKLRSAIQIIFQDPYSALNPRMIVLDSLLEGLRIQHKIRSVQEGLSIADAALTQVELDPNMKWRYPHEFSGGQRQRICIARALTLSPELLILDEPTSALDVSTQKQILELLEKLQRERGIAYLLITHNLSVVNYLAHRVCVMQRGKIVEYGDTQTVLTSPQHQYTKILVTS